MIEFLKQGTACFSAEERRSIGGAAAEKGAEA
jgi:hypothetical protein